MSRPRKQVVDYFPHFCNQGRTMFIIEQAYGNDGYAFWFKVLEILGTSDGHFYDMNKPENIEFLTAKTRLEPDICVGILDKLARLDAIDAELWNEKIIWSDHFVDNISEAYRKRASERPGKPPIRRKNQPETGQSVAGNPHSRVEESRVEESKVEDICAEQETCPTPPVLFMPLIDGTHYPVTQEQVDTWSDLYRAVDVTAELRKMIGWLKANPKNRKTKSGVMRFMTNWLSRQQDSARASPRPAAAARNIGNFEQRQYSRDQLDELYEKI